MKEILWFNFYLKLPNGKEIEVEISGSSFKECLKDAQERASYIKAKIVAWVEL